MKTAKAFSVRCRAYRSESVRLNHVKVLPDGEILVWDSEGEEWMPCHELNARQQRRIRRIAKEFRA